MDEKRLLGMGKHSEMHILSALQNTVTVIIVRPDITPGGV
jgi:hypothetical protein